MEYATLYNGVKMPLVGLGVMLTHGDQCEQMVKDALDVGYRLFDTAKAYENEAAVQQHELHGYMEKYHVHHEAWDLWLRSGSKNLSPVRC